MVAPQATIASRSLAHHSVTMKTADTPLTIHSGDSVNALWRRVMLLRLW